MIDIMHDPAVEDTAYAFRVRDVFHSKYIGCTPRRRRWALMTDDDERCPPALHAPPSMALRARARQYPTPI